MKKTTNKTAYRDLQVSVSYGSGNCVRSQSFRLEAEKLPQSLQVDGLMVTVESMKKEKPRNGEPKPVNPDRIASRGARNLKSVEITLPDAMTADEPTWKKYFVFPVPREVRTFFPKYKADFVLRSPRGEFVVAIASANGVETDPYRGGYISKGISQFFRAHNDLAPGDTVVFKKDGKAEVDGKQLQVYTVRVK